eukprot:1157302-Pelagomonas_calceolata.AAC.26
MCIDPMCTGPACIGPKCTDPECKNPICTGPACTSPTCTQPKGPKEHSLMCTSLLDCTQLDAVVGVATVVSVVLWLLFTLWRCCQYGHCIWGRACNYSQRLLRINEHADKVCKAACAAVHAKCL